MKPLPLIAGSWPTPQTRLYIHDHAGVWSYRGHMECGRETYILIESYDRSASLWAHTEWRVVRIERLYSLADEAEKVSAS